MEILRKKNRIPKNNGIFKRQYRFIPNALYIGEGINLRNVRSRKRYREVDIYKSADMRNTHLIVLGRTRWGKTRLLERAIVDDIESRRSIFHIDPKMDYENLEAILDAIIRLELYDKFLPFIPYYDKVSLKINPFYKQIPDAISDIVKAMSPAGKEDFFKELGGEVAKAVSIAKYLQGESEVRFVDIFKYTSVDEIEKLYDEIKEASLDGYVVIGNKKYEKMQLKAEGLLSLNKLRQKDRTYWSKVNTTIEIVLSQMSTGETGLTFGRAKGNPLYDKMSEGYSFIFTSLLGSLFIGKDSAYRMSRMINAMHEKVYGVLYAKFQRLEPPISEYWDEGSVVIYDGAIEKINKVGRIGGAIHIFTQSLSDFNLNVGKEGAKVFFDNADYVLLSVIDRDTAEYFSNASGEVYRSKPMWTREEGVIAVPEKTRLISSDLFMRMPKGAFHSFIEGSWYRGYSPMLEDRRRIIIEPLPYPDTRIIQHFAKKYNLDLNEASRIIKQNEVYYDYDWIMKEGLADIWIDLKEFPYYKNYVRDYKDDSEEIIAHLGRISGLNSGLKLTEKSLKTIKEVLDKKKGSLTMAFISGDFLYIHYYTFLDIFGIEPLENWIEEVDERKYVKVKIKEKQKKVLKDG